MRTDTKILYYLRNYGIAHQCHCKKCDTQVLRSHRKGYDYYCPYCKTLLFTEEVNISSMPRDLQDDREVMEALKHSMPNK